MLPNAEVEIKQLEPIEEMSGKLRSDFSDKKLMRSVLDGDKQSIEDGKLITDAINQSMGSFVPDLIFENLVRNYSLAEQLYGESIIRKLSGYDASYVKNNIHNLENIADVRHIPKNIYRHFKNRKKRIRYRGSDDYESSFSWNNPFKEKFGSMKKSIDNFVNY